MSVLTLVWLVASFGISTATELSIIGGQGIKSTDAMNPLPISSTMMSTG